MVFPNRPSGASIRAILRFVSVCFCVLLTGIAINGFTARSGIPRDERVAATSWDREGAAKYLDERMELWFTTAKKLRTGQSETACVSCHTTIPYVLARPALRLAMGVSSATPLERRLVEEVTRRVESYDAHQLLYDFNDSKQTESRGTEAVINALILANADAAEKRREPGGPTKKALERLWKTQRTDGAWDWLDFGLEPFESVDGAYYGATLAALAIGIAPGSSDSRAVEAGVGTERLRKYLKEKYATQSIFNRVWLMLAATRLSDLLTKAQRESMIAEIQSRQRDDGGWALDSLGAWRWGKTVAPFKAPGTLDASLLAKSDGYATGLIVYTLRQAGFSNSHPVVSKGLQWLRANQSKVEVGQQSWHAWRAHSLNFDRERGGDKGEPWRRMFMSDSATAFAAMALAASD